MTNIISVIKDGNPLIIFLTIVIVLIFNYKSIIEFLDSRKKLKISKIEDALECENIKGLDRELLENELTKEQFKTTIGLDVEKEFREAIINAHKNTKGELKFLHFIRALPFLRYEDETLGVHISTFELIGSIINIIISIIMVFTGYVLFAYQLFNFSLNNSIPILGLSVILMLIGLFIFGEIRHIISAKIVLTELKKQSSSRK